MVGVKGGMMGGGGVKGYGGRGWVKGWGSGGLGVVEVSKVG